MNKYAYGWSINFSINPIHFLLVKIWVGSRNWEWTLRHPIHIRKGLL